MPAKSSWHALVEDDPHELARTIGRYGVGWLDGIRGVFTSRCFDALSRKVEDSENLVPGYRGEILEKHFKGIAFGKTVEKRAYGHTGSGKAHFT